MLTIYMLTHFVYEYHPEKDILKMRTNDGDSIFWIQYNDVKLTEAVMALILNWGLVSLFIKLTTAGNTSDTSDVNGLTQVPFPNWHHTEYPVDYAYIFNARKT